MAIALGHSSQEEEPLIKTNVVKDNMFPVYLRIDGCGSVSS